MRAKLAKKKIDKTAKIEGLVVLDEAGKKLTVTPRKDNGALILKGERAEHLNKDGRLGTILFRLKQAEFTQLMNYFHAYAILAGEDTYEIYDRAYSEELNIYKDEVERSISVAGSRISYICYTGDETDDDWTYLTPARVKECLRLMLPELFKGELKENELHPGIWEKYKKFVKKTEN